MSGVSFKIEAPGRQSRPAPPPSRGRAGGARFGTDSSSDDDDGNGQHRGARKGKGKEERVDEFGKTGATAATGKKKKEEDGPLVIPSLPNREWQKSSKHKHYVPGLSDRPVTTVTTTDTGMDVDTVNATAIQGGLAQPTPRPRPVAAATTTTTATTVTSTADEVAPPESEEQRALRELLKGSSVSSSNNPLDDLVLPAQPDSLAQPGIHNKSQEARETDAFRQDVGSRPDSAPLEAYERIPVDQFGAAMLRGMGWKAGTAASKTGRKGPTEAYVTPARPALLGIGAKPMDPSLTTAATTAGGKKGAAAVRKDRKAEYKFSPLVRVEKESAAASTSTSNASSRASSPRVLTDADESSSSSTASRHRHSRHRSPSSASSSTRDHRDRENRPRSRSRSPPPRHNRDRDRRSKDSSSSSYRHRSSHRDRDSDRDDRNGDRRYDRYRDGDSSDSRRRQGEKEGGSHRSSRAGSYERPRVDR